MSRASAVSRPGSSSLGFAGRYRSADEESVPLNQSRPLADQDRLNPRAKALQSAPYRAWHTESTEGAQSSRVHGDFASEPRRALRGGGEDLGVRVREACEVGRHLADIRAGVGESLGHGGGALAGEPGTDPQILPGHAIGQQTSKPFASEAELLGAAVARPLRQVGCGQRQVHAQPI
jgi:hypothetical protein